MRIANRQKPDLSRGMARTLRRIYVEISEARALIDPRSLIRNDGVRLAG
jgi:hypothetical protein